jgi:hypothetical protein
MKKSLLLGLLFAFLGLLLIVLRANDVPHQMLLFVIFIGLYLPQKFMQRRKGEVSKKSAHISIALVVIGIVLLITHNTYAYPVLCFTLLSDLIFPLIFKKK